MLSATNRTINLTAHQEQKKACIVNNATMHVLMTSSNRDHLIEVLDTLLPTGDTYAQRGYVIQSWYTVSNAIKQANDIQ